MNSIILKYRRLLGELSQTEILARAFIKISIFLLITGIVIFWFNAIIIPKLLNINGIYDFNKKIFYTFAYIASFLLIISQILKAKKELIISLSKRTLFLITIYTIPFITSLHLIEYIELPFKNPWKVTGQLVELRYNPANDVVRFLIIVIIPSLTLFIIYRLKKTINVTNIYDTNYNPIKSRTILLLLYILTITIFIIFAGSICLLYNNSTLDLFHEGETLGPAIDYIYEKIPYRDTLFVHGLFQDPLRSVIAFKLFGKSIEASRIFESLLSMLTLLFVFIAIYFIYEKKIYYYSLATMVFLIVIHKVSPNNEALVFTTRDITLYIFLILSSIICRTIKNNHYEKSKIKTHIILFLFSFQPTTAFAYSIDRGFYLTAASIVTSILIFLLFLMNKNRNYLFSIISGYVLGILFLTFAFKGAIYEFFKFTFIVMPQYKELMDGLVYQFMESKYTKPVAAISLCLFWLTYRYAANPFYGTIINKIRSFYKYYFMEILLFILSIFYFRSALGRSDWGYIPYSLAPTIILITYIIIKHYLEPTLNKGNSKKLLFFLILALSTLSTVYYNRIAFKHLYNFSFNKPDSEHIPSNYKNTIKFLKENLNKKEYFFTMTFEAIWYYFVNKPCPSRFQIVWFSTPLFYQKQVVEGLKRKNVKFIIYGNSYWSNKVDGYDKEKRLPFITNYIKQQYVFYKKIDDNEIWINKNEKIPVSKINIAPQPIIQANESTKNIKISSKEKLSIVVSLHTGTYTGNEADWQILTYTPFGTHYYNASLSKWQVGHSLTYQGKLFNFINIKILEISELPPGTYTFKFQVDLKIGNLRNGNIHSNSIVVNVIQ